MGGRGHRHYLSLYIPRTIKFLLFSGMNGDVSYESQHDMIFTFDFLSAFMIFSKGISRQHVSCVSMENLFSCGGLVRTENSKLMVRCSLFG